MRKWTKGTREYASPPILRPDQSLAISHQDKCDAIRDELFQQPPPLAEYPRPPPLLEPSAGALPYDRVTYAEVRSSIYSFSTSSAPGMDGVPLLSSGMQLMSRVRKEGNIELKMTT